MSTLFIRKFYVTLLLAAMLAIAACADGSAGADNSSPTQTASNSTPSSTTAAGTPAPTSSTPASGTPTLAATAGVTSTATVTGTAAPTGTLAMNWNPNGAGGNNIVKVNNKQDGRFMFRSNIDLGQTSSPNVGPENLAEAVSSCVDCQSIAVAVQVVLYKKGATKVTPQNEAIALNINCTRCITVARAIQYVIPVDDPKDVPKSVDGLVKDMNRELKYFEQIKSVNEIDPKQAEERLNKIIAQYADLQQFIRDVRQQAVGSSTPTPALSVTPAATPTSGATSAPTAVPQATQAPTSAPSPTSAQPTQAATPAPTKAP